MPCASLPGAISSHTSALFTALRLVLAFACFCYFSFSSPTSLWRHMKEYFVQLTLRSLCFGTEKVGTTLCIEWFTIYSFSKYFLICNRIERRSRQHIDLVRTLYSLMKESRGCRLFQRVSGWTGGVKYYENAQERNSPYWGDISQCPSEKILGLISEQSEA